MTSKLPIALKDLLRQSTVEDERTEHKAGLNSAGMLQRICAVDRDGPASKSLKEHT